MKPLLFLTLLCLALPSGLSAADKSYSIAVVPKGTTHEFWKAINAGAFKARDELAEQGIRVNVIWKGPLREDDRDQQIQTVENFTSQRVNGIVLAPLDSRALIRPVLNAGRARVPVVIFDSGLENTNYVSFVATDNYKGGVLAAEHLARLMDGKGNVILLRYAVGSASTEQREAGFLDSLKNSYPGLKLIASDQYAGPTRETAYQASQNLLTRFGRDVQGIFCPNENSTVGMTKALRGIGKAGGAVKLVGFDAGSESVQDLKNGDLQGLVVQNPIFMGYKSVMTMVEHLQGKPVERRIDTGVVVATKDNMDEPFIHQLLNPPIAKYLK